MAATRPGSWCGDGSDRCTGRRHVFLAGRGEIGPPATRDAIPGAARIPAPPAPQPQPPVTQSPAPPAPQPQPPVKEPARPPRATEPARPPQAAKDRQPAEKPGVPIETGREILYPTDSESSDYALYSYILFRGATSPSNEDRYVAALAAFLDEIPEIRELLRRHARKSELNIAYIPLKENPVTSAPRDWLAQYDFTRARLLLRTVPMAAQD